MIKKLDDLIVAALEKGKRKIVVAYAQDAHTLQAVGEAVENGIVEATLLGDPAKIKEVCTTEGINYNKFTVVPCFGDSECVAEAVRMVSQGEGDILMKGLVSTDKYMRGILNKECGLLPNKGILSHVTVFQLPQYHKLLVATDVAVIPYPDLSQKLAMVRYVKTIANVLGVDHPKLACIAPSEQMLPGIQSCVDAAIISKMGDRGQFGKLDVDGPLSLDTALFESVAKAKHVQGSKVAGDPDCLLFPSIDAANVFYKCTTKLCGGDLAALVMGTKVPCVLTSRDDSQRSKLYSIALGVLSCK